MRKFTLLLAIAGLLALAAGAILAGSPYAPSAAPAPENIEDVWAIEDARQESDAPLVTALEMNGVPLMYNAQENVFYGTLGMAGEDWPAMRLTAPHDKGVQLCLVDDYAYDGRADAVAGGYTYQVLCYTDEAFSYIDIAFTGLPMVQLRCGEAITALDTPVEFVMSAFGEAPVHAPARAHQRGDRSQTWKPKIGYKVEFTRGGDSGKVLASIPGMGDVEQVLLLPLAIDGTMMRDRLSWDLVGRAFDEDEGFGGLPCQYVEVYLNDSYEGVYLMLRPYDVGDEMRKAGQEAVFRDSLYRVSSLEMEKDRPVLAHPIKEEVGFELFYAPSMARGFDALAPYIDLITETDDAAFAEKAQACLNIDSLLRYFLIMQAGCMVDNTSNNRYIWAHRTAGGVQYRFAFWDMDLTWGMYAGDEGDRWVELDVAERVIALDVSGAKARTKEIWADLKARGITAQTVEELTTQYVHELGDSGAYARDAARWEKGDFYPDGYVLASFAASRFEMMDAWVEAL